MEHRKVLTFVMTIEYNGFRYAGFQRQTATPRTLDKSQPRRNEPRQRKATIQSAIENALQSWTHLSIATLRVRGSGRTDKGVHASGQVVAFDVPFGFFDDESDGNDSRGEHCECESEERRGCDDVPLQQAKQHLREAYLALAKHKLKPYGDEKDASNRKNTDQWRIRRAIMTRLPADIALRSVRLWTGACPFEARKGILCKTYLYKLRYRSLRGDGAQSSRRNTQYQNSDTAHDPKTDPEERKRKRTSGELHPICNAGPHMLRRIDDQNSVWLCPWPLDPALLRQACDAFIGRRDFFHFVHKDERNRPGKSTEKVCGDRRTPHEIDLMEFRVRDAIEEGAASLASRDGRPPVMDVTFCLRAKGFHRGMVRNLVGYVVDVARGVRGMDEIPTLLMGKSSGSCAEVASKVAAVNSAPACGLCLAEVEYEYDNFL